MDQATLMWSDTCKNACCLNRFIKLAVQDTDRIFQNVDIKWNEHQYNSSYIGTTDGPEKFVMHQADQ